MRKFLLDYNLKVSLPVILFVAIATFAITYYASYAERNGVGYQPGQPIKFSHKLHAGDMKVDCQYCHVGVEKSRVASVPSVDMCMNCHTLAKKDSPEIQKLTWYYNEGIAIPWKRVHRVPDFVYFNHSVHINKGLQCVSCHGDVPQMDVITQVKNLNMGACLDCHRNAHDKLPYIKDVKNGPDNCATCHR